MDSRGPKRQAKKDEDCCLSHRSFKLSFLNEPSFLQKLLLLYYTMVTKIDEVKLGGAKRKNGHKMTCTCHICENIKNKAKRGGYTEEVEKQAEFAGGYKKKNGHRANCKCPICRNMKSKKRRHAKKGGKHTRRGGSDDGMDEEKSSEDREEESEEEESEEEREVVPETNEEDEDDEEEESKDNEPSEESKESELDLGEDEEEEGKEMMGGKKRKGKSHRKGKTHRKGKKIRKKGNGHKPTCSCPICQNMRSKSKKGGAPEEEELAKDDEYEALKDIPSASVGGRRTRKHRRKSKGRKRRSVRQRAY